MQSFAISDIKNFMGELFSKDTFDSYEFVEAVVKMGISYEIDGHVNREFYDTEAQENLPKLARWKDARPQVLHIIKGKRRPLSMKIILKLPQKIQEALIEQLPGVLSSKDLEGCYINILYEPGGLTCTTGISYRTFLLDKSFERLFDEYVSKQLLMFLR